jgi:hypothetical protein
MTILRSHSFRDEAHQRQLCCQCRRQNCSDDHSSRPYVYAISLGTMHLGLGILPRFDEN